jgi:chondroitin 4-sulfotransferase 11
MFISPATRALFVHVQKTGGSAIEEAFHRADTQLRLSCDSFAGSLAHRCGERLWRWSIPAPYRPARHLKARQIHARLGDAAWHSFFTFGFVRNPWDRLVSWYSMCRQSRRLSRFGSYVRDSVQTFDAFIERADDTPMLARTCVPQLEYFEDEHGNRLVDFIGQYEHLDRDLGAIADRLQVVLAAPRVNTSRHPHYRQMYTPSTRDLVARRFARDIDAFGYDF